MENAHSHHDHAEPDTASDPVCGMNVEIATARDKADHEGHTYYFCSLRCRTKFINEPLRYLKPVAPASTDAALSAAPGTIYTCPMHPEIRKLGPGSCPICGMALEPEMASAGSGANPELAPMTR